MSLFLGTDNYDSPIALCKDGTTNSCSGTSDSWSNYNINPLEYGITGSSTFKLLLTVKDENGNLDYVDYHEVTWSPAIPPSSGSSGSITSPSSTAQGDFTVSCNAEDSAGLEKVSVVFSTGDTLVLCEDGTGTSCSGNSDSWSKKITPADYGITSQGTYTLSLWVANEDGDSPTRVDTQTVNWSPKTPPSTGSTGSITSPGSSAEGYFTVSCNAEDPAGLKKVSVVFPGGDTLVLCEDGTSESCSGTSDSWSESITPAEYGITVEGAYILKLWVSNEDGGSASLVDTQTVNWSPELVPVNTPPSGSFTAPSDLVNGLVTVQATASDADGLKKVSVVFVPNGTPLVLCDDASSHACSGTSGSWEVAGINPVDYGATAGNIILGLHVQDDSDGNSETLVASTEFTWIPPNNQFPKDSKYFNVCVGHNYEQQMPLARYHDALGVFF